MMVSCHSGGLPSGVLDARQMVAFLSDAYLLEGFYAVESQYRYDTMSPEVLRAYDDILAKHNISREQAEKSFAYYSEHPELYAPIQDSVLAIIERVSNADTIAAVPTSESLSSPDFRLTM